ncbi:MAG: hypothetical protein ACE5IH_08900, partial [Thermodesulfobacteriota bacterium]
NYYQKYRGPEIDFILDKRSAFEVKISPVPSDINRLQRIARQLRLKDNYLITKNYSYLPNVILAQDL